MSGILQVEWLQPYTDAKIKELGASGVKQLLAVPISFVSEHIETLEEIDMEYRELAIESGIKVSTPITCLLCTALEVSWPSSCSLADYMHSKLLLKRSLGVDGLAHLYITFCRLVVKGCQAAVLCTHLVVCSTCHTCA